jgi:UDP-N-acetylglucosamine 4,6-dehydratase
VDLNGKSILVTGGTGSFGKAFIQHVLKEYSTVKRLVVVSRDEQKHHEMMTYLSPKDYSALEYRLGDVRDKDRMMELFRGIDIVVHAAAMKHVPASELNPMECVKTNILGSQNVIDAAQHNQVKVVVALSTDKASSPSNFYGASKLCLEKLFIHADSQKGDADIRYSVVRYANVFASKGSVIPLFLKLKDTGVLPVTHPDMTRFSITIDKAVELVYFAIKNGWGGEIILPICPSYRLRDVAKAIAPDAELRILGARPGEKMHETMFTEIDAPYTAQRDDYYIICPITGTAKWNREMYCMKTGATPVSDGMSYDSGKNDHWLSHSDIQSQLSSGLFA